MKRSTSLLVTAICSQLVPWGLALFAFGSFGGMFGSVNWIALLGCFFPMMIGGPILLGLYLNSGWRGLLAGIFASFLGWLCFSITTNVPFIGSPLYIGVASVIIITLLVLTQKVSKNDFVWAILGMGFGGVLSAISLNFWNRAVLGLYVQFFLTFLWVWLSVIFFPDLFQRRAGRNDVIAWVAMMAVFPFIIDSIYTVVFGKGR